MTLLFDRFIDRLQQGLQLIVTLVMTPGLWLVQQSWTGKKKDVSKRLKKWFGRN